MSIGVSAEDAPITVEENGEGEGERVLCRDRGGRDRRARSAYRAGAEISASSSSSFSSPEPPSSDSLPELDSSTSSNLNSSSSSSLIMACPIKYLAYTIPTSSLSHLALSPSPALSITPISLALATAAPSTPSPTHCPLHRLHKTPQTPFPRSIIRWANAPTSLVQRTSNQALVEPISCSSAWTRLISRERPCGPETGAEGIVGTPDLEM